MKTKYNLTTFSFRTDGIWNVYNRKSGQCIGTIAYWDETKHWEWAQTEDAHLWSGITQEITDFLVSLSEKKKSSIIPLLIILLISTLIMGCSSTKHVISSKTSQDKVTDQKSSVQTDKTINTVIVAKNQVTEKTTEIIDTNVMIPSKEISGSGTLNDVISGKTIYTESNDQTIKTEYDPITKTIKSTATIKPSSVPVHNYKTTERIITGDQMVNKIENIKTDSSGQVKEKEKIKTENIDKTVSTNPVYLIIGIVCMIAIIACIAIIIIKKIH